MIEGQDRALCVCRTAALLREKTATVTGLPGPIPPDSIYQCGCHSARSEPFPDPLMHPFPGISDFTLSAGRAPIVNAVSFPATGGTDTEG